MNLIIHKTHQQYQVGLYNNANQLVAVGKLAQPLQSSNTTDTTILVNLDL